MSDLVGSGLWIRESNRLGSDVSQYETLRSYDEAAYLWRRATDVIQGPIDEGGVYRGSLLLSEMPVRLNGHRVPVLLSMVAGYIYSRLCDASSGLINALIPYRYVRGRDHGKVEGRYRFWDMRVRADGKEGIVEQVRHRVWEYERRRLDSLLTRWDTESRCCAYVVEERNGPVGLHVVFSDKEALRHVRFQSFVDDCRELMREGKELEEAVREETDLLACYIEAQLSDICAHQPNVRPIRRRYRTRLRPVRPYDRAPRWKV